MSQRRSLTPLAAIAMALALLGATTARASAHERRTVGGYNFVVGFLNEPSYLEAPNGASITITTSDGKTVDDAQKTLKVEISTGGASQTMDLKAVFGKPGAYSAEFIPTKAGGYSFRFFGTLGTQQINEKFDSGPGRFDDVKTRSDVEFPTKVPSNGELAAQVSALKPVGDQGAQASTPSSADIQKALDRANSARTTGLVAGGLGIILALAGIGLALSARGARGRAIRPAGGSGEPL